MKKKNIGSKLDDFLREESLLEESTAIAVKRVIAWQIEREMEKQNLTKTSMAKKMHTSRSAVDRLLNPNNLNITLDTIDRACIALGIKPNIYLV
jgi:DNA-binding Xre family transcriptional regulator